MKNLIAVLFIAAICTCLSGCWWPKNDCEPEVGNRSYEEMLLEYQHGVSAVQIQGAASEN